MIREKLRLYRNRVKAFRAEDGSIAYHEATAKIRVYHGDDVGAFIHSLTAAMKHLKEMISEMVSSVFGELAEAVSDLNDSMDEPILDGQQVSKGMRR